MHRPPPTVGRFILPALLFYFRVGFIRPRLGFGRWSDVNFCVLRARLLLHRLNILLIIYFLFEIVWRTTDLTVYLESFSELQILQLAIRRNIPTDDDGKKRRSITLCV